MASVTNRIAQLVAATGLSRKAFAEAVGVDTKSISNYIERDMIPSPRVRNLILEAFPAVSKEWLEDGVGGMFVSEDNVDLVPTRVSEGDPYYAVDFSCGFDAVENDATAVPTKMLKSPFNRSGIVWCDVSGMSMYPTLTPGDIIALEEVHDYRYVSYGEIYAIVACELRSVKRIRKGSDPTRWMLVPDNTDGGYQEQEIEIKDVIHLYKVIGFTHKF